ncbi:hypothetical protein EDD37DRAFT_401572 [Exophiala viscosa]|uniref:Uncharacterized protein n=1 Tax=Exophiala viscosa TaxID=2486360 RepID=A0AAN6DYF8_9EURO|nr:hypothetical protein EDD36DRAFT_169697 [Exophiala viscosa]KAI1624150.1 hypothetical protein EDD37DRAFT_401572 [Exophiala viscosa]
MPPQSNEEYELRCAQALSDETIAVEGMLDEERALLPARDADIGGNGDEATTEATAALIAKSSPSQPSSESQKVIRRKRVPGTAPDPEHSNERTMGEPQDSLLPPSKGSFSIARARVPKTGTINNWWIEISSCILAIAMLFAIAMIIDQLSRSFFARMALWHFNQRHHLSRCNYHKGGGSVRYCRRTQPAEMGMAKGTPAADNSDELRCRDSRTPRLLSADVQPTRPQSYCQSRCRLDHLDSADRRHHSTSRVLSRLQSALELSECINSAVK